MRLRVIVAGKDRNRKRFREACETIVINAHGALLVLSQSLDDDAQLVVTNPYHQRTPFAGGNELIRVSAVQNHDGISAHYFVERDTHGVFKRSILFFLHFLDEVHQYFSICI